MMMSNEARLGLREIPLVPWKGRTFSQVSAVIRYNGTIPVPNNTRLFMKPLPQKIFRREIASSVGTQTNSRASVMVRDFEIPGANIVHSSYNGDLCKVGLVNTIDMNLPYGKTPYPGSACYNTTVQLEKNTNSCLSTESNALRRVRSSGMIKRKFNTNKNNDTYYTSNAQYLESRNKLYQQNQFHLLRVGDPTSTPGGPGSYQNVYASATPSHCGNDLTTTYVPVYYKPNNSEFGTQGAVSDSTRLLRKKYNTITYGGEKLRSAFGNATTNALAYSSPQNAFTLKDRIGYPLKKTPVVSKYNGNVDCVYKSPSSISVRTTCASQ